MYFSEEETKKIQALELVMLKEVDRVTKEIGIEFFMKDGSLLGTIRHNGFIPWDDDIDIAMTRDDYEIFIKKAPDFLKENYHLKNILNEDKNPYGFSKIRVDNTIFAEYYTKDLPIHHGCYMDIYPIDFTTSDEKKLKKQIFKVRLFLQLYNRKIIRCYYKKPENLIEHFYDIIVRILHGLCLLIPMSAEDLFKIAEKEMMKYEDCKEKVVCFYNAINSSESLEYYDLFPLKKHKYEDMEVNIPNNYDKYLTQHYGDYMKYPKEEMRYGHKPYIFKI